MEKNKLWAIVSVTLLVLLGACAPKTNPIPVSPQATAQAISSDAAWQKVLTEAKREGKVTIYTLNFTGDVGVALSKAFEDKYGIKLEFVTGQGSTHLERLKSEQATGKRVADILDSATLMWLTLAKTAGLTEAVGYLPVLKDKDLFTVYPVDEEGHYITAGIIYSTLYLSTAIVRPGQEPQGWKELTDPKWKGKVVFQSPESSVSLSLVQTVFVDKYKVLDKDYLQKLAANDPKMVITLKELGTVLAQGQNAVAYAAANVMNPLIKQGAPIKAMAPAEGNMAQPMPALTVIKGAPNPNAARVFINWLLTQEGETVYGKAMGTFSTRKDVPDFSPEGGKFKPTKVFNVDSASLSEAQRQMNTGITGQIFGIKK